MPITTSALNANFIQVFGTFESAVSVIFSRFRLLSYPESRPFGALPASDILPEIISTLSGRYPEGYVNAIQQEAIAVGGGKGGRVRAAGAEQRWARRIGAWEEEEPVYWYII
jgi:hypothetical protein